MISNKSMKEILGFAKKEEKYKSEITKLKKDLTVARRDLRRAKVTIEVLR